MTMAPNNSGKTIHMLSHPTPATTATHRRATSANVSDDAVTE